MAGYNGRTSQSNATTSNDQIIRQRAAINVRTAQGLGEEEINNQTKAGYGIAKSQSALFSGPTPEEIISGSFGLFLDDVEASNNPDFHTKFSPSDMQTFNQIKVNAPIPNDSPAIGSGPNLKALDIDDVIKGSLPTEAIPNVGNGLEGSRGFGWQDSKHTTTTIGSYLKNKYSVDSTDASETVIKGERVDVDAINYE